MYIARVAQKGSQVTNKSDIAFGRVVLGDENVVFQAIPAASPVFIGPANTERKIDILVVKIIVERSFEQAFTVKPVIIKSKTMDAIFASQFNLAFFHFWQTQIIKSEFAGQVWLVCPTNCGTAFETLLHSVNPRPHQLSFSGIG